MKTIYRLRKDSAHDSEEALHIAYGIEALNEQGYVVESIENVFFNKATATNFIALCNELDLSLLHLFDVVEDILE